MPELGNVKSANEARALLADFASVPTEDIPFAEADGRVLARAVTADEDLPQWPRAAMDGYAVRAADTAGAPVRLSVRGSVSMGEAWTGLPPGPGETLAVPTGAAVPEPCDAVVMIEHTRAIGPTVEIAKPVRSGENLVRPGDDVRRGDLLLPAGRRLRAVDLGALAALGMLSVSVYRRPRVAILSTGNELVPPSATPRRGQVRDVNGFLLGAQVRRAGCEAIAGGVTGDDATALARRSAELLEGADALILSGGSSVGTRDLTGLALAELAAEVLCHGIAVKPGRPTLFARVGGKPVLGLPGVPASAAIIFEVFVRPLLGRLGGDASTDPWPNRRRARLARPVVSVAGREDYVRVALLNGGGDIAQPLGGPSSALATLIRADGLLVVPADRIGFAEGEEVEVFLSV